MTGPRSGEVETRRGIAFIQLLDDAPDGDAFVGSYAACSMSSSWVDPRPVGGQAQHGHDRGWSV